MVLLQCRIFAQDFWVAFFAQDMCKLSVGSLGKFVHRIHERNPSLYAGFPGLLQDLCARSLGRNFLTRSVRRIHLREQPAQDLLQECLDRHTPQQEPSVPPEVRRGLTPRHSSQRFNAPSPRSAGGPLSTLKMHTATVRTIKSVEGAPICHFQTSHSTERTPE